jgi:hypothetical protein
MAPIVSNCLLLHVHENTNGRQLAYEPDRHRAQYDGSLSSDPPFAKRPQTNNGDRQEAKHVHYPRASYSCGTAALVPPCPGTVHSSAPSVIIVLMLVAQFVTFSLPFSIGSRAGRAEPGCFSHMGGGEIASKTSLYS